MPIIVSCPSCQGKLRVADELREQMVRCPTCSVTFFPAGDTPASPPPRPQWQDLSLEPIPDRNEPVEPELFHGNDPTSADRPRLPTEDRDALDHDPQTFTHQPRRRDMEPDRGALVLTLGVLSLAVISMGCAPVGLILGLAAWVMGQSDLRKMRARVMDDRGQSLTHGGWICGILGTLINLLLCLACLGIWVAIMASTPKAPTPAPVRTSSMKPAPNPRGGLPPKPDGR